MSVDLNPTEPVTKKLKYHDGLQERLSDGYEKLQVISNNNDSQDKTHLGINGTNEMEKQKVNVTLEDSDDEITSMHDDNDNDNLLKFPPDNDISDMLEGIKYSGVFPNVTERYLTPYYKTNVQKFKDDICIWIHTNRICIISLAPSHFLLEEDKTIMKVDFRISDKLDRALNKVSGKSKHGAQPLQTNSNICAVSYSNGQTHMIKCCMIGKLVEVNVRLLEKPELLKESPHKGGYLAIILPNIKLLEKMKEALLTHEQYEISLQLNNSNTVNHSDTTQTSLKKLESITDHVSSISNEQELVSCTNSRDVKS